MEGPFQLSSAWWHHPISTSANRPFGLWVTLQVLWLTRLNLFLWIWCYFMYFCLYVPFFLITLKMFFSSKCRWWAQFQRPSDLTWWCSFTPGFAVSPWPVCISCEFLSNIIERLTDICIKLSHDKYINNLNKSKQTAFIPYIKIKNQQFSGIL